MLWSRPPHTPAPPRGHDDIVAAALPVEFGADMLERHYQALEEATRTMGGPEALVDSLAGKQKLFAAALDRDALARLDLEALDALLETVFSARRRLFPLFERSAVDLQVRMQALLYAEAPLAERMEGFFDGLPIEPGQDAESRKRFAKLRRAARDFAAECLHFRDPLRYPLMTRWVWDPTTMSGALREFVPSNAHLARLPLDDRPETFEGARAWVAGQIEAKGIYRDVPLWIDLVLASAYSHYFRSMTGGTLGGDFTRGLGPGEDIRKLLGIDPLRAGGKSRVVKQA